MSTRPERIGATLRIDLGKVDLGQFRRELAVEFDYGSRDPETNVTSDNVVLTGKIAWAHLKEFPDYYARLDRLEAEANAYWDGRRRVTHGCRGSGEMVRGAPEGGTAAPRAPCQWQVE